MALILAIDDSRTTLQILEKHLLTLGHTTLIADNGEEGLELARTGNPDVILLDLILPGMDGFDILEQLKNNDATRDIPVIIISAQTSKQNIVKVMKYEIKDYLSKQFNMKTFKEKIDRAIAYRERYLKEQKNNSRAYSLLTQLGRTTISFRTGIKECHSEAKNTFNASFFKKFQDSAIVIDIRYVPSLAILDIPKLEEIMELVPGEPVYLIAGRHFGTIMLNTELNDRIQPFISTGDMEIFRHTSDM